jgi:hypothetical protein
MAARDNIDPLNAAHVQAKLFDDVRGDGHGGTTGTTTPTGQAGSLVFDNCRIELGNSKGKTFLKLPFEIQTEAVAGNDGSFQARMVSFGSFVLTGEPIGYTVLAVSSANLNADLVGLGAPFGAYPPTVLTDMRKRMALVNYQINFPGSPPAVFPVDLGAMLQVSMW